MPTFRVSVVVPVEVSYLVNAPDEDAALSHDVRINKIVYSSVRGGLECRNEHTALYMLDDGAEWDKAEVVPADPVADRDVVAVVSEGS